MNERIAFSWKALIVFFVLSLVIPAAFQIARGIFLAILTFGSVVTLNVKKISYNKTVINLFILNIAASIFYILIGFLNNSPGVVKVSTVYFVWPILFLYFVGFMNTTKVAPYFNYGIIAGGILSCLLILNNILNTFGYLSINNNIISEALGFSVFWEGGFTKISSTNLVTVFCVYVLTLAILLLPKPIRKTIYPKSAFVIFAMVMCAVLLFLSGRRAFWLIGMLSLVIIILIYHFSGLQMNFKRYFIYLAIVLFISVFLFSYLAFDNDRFLQEFSSIFVFDDPSAESNLLRKEQYEALMQGWSISPIWGSGLGSVAPGSIRDPIAPWNYELSYIALLFQTGIVGVIIYTCSILWIVFKSIQLVRKNKENAAILLPLVCTLVSFLLVNATNPYLAKFDYLWVIFLPVGIINGILVMQEKNEKRHAKI
jgi:O-antigen ligase